MQRGVSVITTPIFTRILTTAEYGQYNIFNSWYGILTVIVSLNLYFGVYTRGLVKYEDRQKEFSSSLQGLNFVLVLFWTIVYFAFRDFWNGLFKLTTVQMLAILVMIWTNAVFHFWSSAQRVNYKYRLLVIITVAVSVMKPAVGIFLINHSQDKVTARILGLVLVELVFYTSFFFIQLFKGKKFYDGKFWKHAIIFNLPLIPHYLSMTVLNGADKIMIGDMVGDSEAGIYQLAYSVSQIMTIFNTALMQTVEPWLYRKIKDNKIEDISAIATTLFIGVAGVNTLMIAFAPEIIKIFGPKEYHEAIPIIPPVTMSVYFMFLYTFFAVFEFYFEKRKYIAIATSIGALLNIVLNKIFISIFGYYAAGYTTLFCYILFALFHYIFMDRIVKANFGNRKAYDIRTLLKITVIFILLGFVLLVTYDYLVIRYCIIIIILCVIWLKRKPILMNINGLIKMKTK